MYQGITVGSQVVRFSFSLSRDTFWKGYLQTIFYQILSSSVLFIFDASCGRVNMYNEDCVYLDSMADLA